MPRNWGPPHKGWSPESWDSSTGWQSRREGAEAWTQFGRRMAVRFIVGFFVFLALLVSLGAFIATVVLGSTTTSRWLVIGLAPLVVAVVVVLIVRYVRRTWLPVRDLMSAAGSLADGDYTARVETHGSTAVQPVARSFNAMAGRLEQADEQRRRLLADLGHELRTPLTVVRGEIEAMLDGVHQADPDHLELLLDEVQVMERLLEDLRTLSLAEAGTLALHPEPTDLVDLVGDVSEAHRRLARAQGVTVTIEAPRSLPDVIVDPVRVREVVANLIVNSLRAMPDGGALRLEVSEEGSSVLITVEDSGTGMSADEVVRAFERFHKGSTSSGSGLGLTISRDLIEAHGGSIAMESKPGTGTIVSVQVPKVVAN